MTEKELKKLNRQALLELLYNQTRRCEELEEKISRLEEQLVTQREQLIKSPEEPGNLAEEALKVNGVFEAAQAAAQQYLEKIQNCSVRCDVMLEDTRKRCEKMEQQAQMRMTMLKEEVEKLQLTWDASHSE